VVLLGALLYFLIFGEDARLNLWSMRILWQLLKGTACSVVLLLGANLLFGKRGGIAVIHTGVALLMISELWVGLIGRENMLRLVEGESSNFVRDIREIELAVIHDDADGRRRVVVIPEHVLQSAAAGAAAPGGNAEPGPAQKIPSDELPLPFDLVVRSYHMNSRLRAPMPDELLSTAGGLAEFAVAEPQPPVTGMEEANDEPAVLLDVVERGSGKTLKTLLVSQNVSELRGVPLAETVAVDGKDFEFYLRWKRTYQDFDVKLKDVSRTTYVGSSTPRDYRSVIEITEHDGGISKEFALWMNNPLRYRGQTFYQSGYTPLPDGTEATTLSVVRNQGWMLPYIACMIVTFGMFAQFGQTLHRFLDRTARQSLHQSRAVGAEPAMPAKSGRSREALVSAAIVACVLLSVGTWLFRQARAPEPDPQSMNLYEFAQVPIAWSGRAQPIDSMARTQLMMASHKSTFEGELEAAELGSPERREKIIAAFKAAWPTADPASLAKFNGSYKQWIDEMARLTSSGIPAIEERVRPLMVRKMPAVQWLLDVIARPEVAMRHRVIRIDNDQILSALGLEKRHGLTFSQEEILPQLTRLDSLLQSARKKQQEKKDSLLSAEERRVVSLGDTLHRIDQLGQLFTRRESDGLLESCVDAWRVLLLLGEESAVNVVPTGSKDEQRAWEAMVGASAVQQMNQQLKTANVTSLDSLLTYLNETQPLAVVRESVLGSCRVLSGLPAAPGQTDAKTSVQQQATAALGRVDDPYLQKILSIIAASTPGQSDAQIADTVTPEQARAIAGLRYSAVLFDVFETLQREKPDDVRLRDIRTRLQSLDASNEDAVTDAMVRELTTLVWNDLQKRVPELLPGGACEATFDRNTTAFAGILTEWQSGDVVAFNKQVTDYRQSLASAALPHLDSALVSKEAWFNFYDPFYKAICVYLPVIVLSFLGWLVFGTTLRRVSLALLASGFLIHTAALIWRMQISGRPPVTNLYSSAVFIGWAAVVAAFVVEVILKNGAGAVIGGATGAATLMIAHYLSREEFRSLQGGDTMGVMQAVLDTTFWLATHVVCITLGYAATFLAGFIGLLYCLQSVTGKTMGGQTSGRTFAETMAMFGKVTYGTICFALFFSLVGTVLGGLWADDSWGRFWGWDPKENGALMIVMWNALILHARWDKLVGDYGTAVLAMVGNIVTAWSWFGVNGLQAGLHSYGFTEGRLYTLGLFVLGQAVVALIFWGLATLSRRKHTVIAEAA
jgi:ABC-type transport system involved in cytochrome c biogenesis permease subunit